MPTFPHPYKGQDVQVEGALVKLDRCVICKVSTAPCVQGKWKAWTTLCMAPNEDGRDTVW
ncbi:hypothetical protein QJQ45_022351, partial [Haematococcus lacustris]